MARGPFQGTFQPNLRPTVVTAPDALVFINGEQDILGCPSCRRKFDLSKYITQIQVNMDIESVPGTATVTMSIPRHVVDDFYYDGVPLLTPMMEIEIYGKGFFVLEGLPQFYPMFWGLITEVSDSYSGGEHTVTINCADILKWWEICRMNINPAYTAPSPQLGKSIFGNVLFGTNPYDCIFSLAQMAFGDVILGTGSLVSLYKEQAQSATFNAALSDIMQYWASRFTKIRSNLLLYGVNGVAVRGDTLAHAYETGKLRPGSRDRATPVANAVRNANGGPESGQLVFDPSDPGVTAFRTQFSQAGEINFWQSEYQTKLEIANACKEAVGFEFYMDVTGDIVFKPPFFNLDILSNKPVSWIQDIDIIDWDFADSEAEVITQLTIQGAFGGNVDYGFGPEITPFTSVTDYHLLRKYGWRPHTYNSEFMGDTLRMFYHGLDIIDRLNSRRHIATINIPFRPELRLGFPIYIEPKDQVWYIKGISHNVQFGGRATTTLTLTARREKFKAPQGIATLKDTGSFSDEHAQRVSAQQKSLTGGAPGGSPPAPPPSSDKKKGPPSPRQVAQKSFSLELGSAGTLPPANVDPNNPASLEPYKPISLRHPKTGKVVGYPNVVMVYSRPYDPSVAFEPLAGQKKAGENKNTKKPQQDKVKERQTVEAKEKVAQLHGLTTDLKEKYAHNRYSFGLNSAGVYVYAYDQAQVISQFSLIPAKNIAVTKDGQQTPTSNNQSSMIRPVSDERGFEVIGHFRYGRGVSLRDGSLLLNEGKANSGNQGQEGNQIIGVQTALSGDLTATLEAASKGLTTITTTYANPAVTLAKLMPEDLQTASAVTPGEGMKNPQFTNTGTNFVDSAPLGSAEQSGVPTSVEASQLSRALTLAEMSVRADVVPGDEDCECQTGRAELTFINVGYQVKNNFPGSGDAPDLTSFGLGGVAPEGPVPPGLKGQDLVQKVESYLFNLYRALDEAHQPFENSLRGDPSGQDPDFRVLPDLFDPSLNDPQFGNFSPPFSTPNRNGLGDPEATAGQILSSAEELVNVWNEFGDRLERDAKKAELAQQIANLKNRIDRLFKRLADVRRAQQDGNVTVGNTDTEEDLLRQIAEAQQELEQKEAELAALG